VLDIGNECYGVFNGLWASCFIEDNSAGDSGPSTKYCGFLCKTKDRDWACPGGLKCGAVNSQGQAVCLP